MLAIQSRTRPLLATKRSALLLARRLQHGSDILTCELCLFTSQDLHSRKFVLERRAVFIKVLSMNQDQTSRLLWMGVQRLIISLAQTSRLIRMLGDAELPDKC